MSQHYNLFSTGFDLAMLIEEGEFLKAKIYERLITSKNSWKNLEEVSKREKQVVLLDGSIWNEVDKALKVNKADDAHRISFFNHASLRRLWMSGLRSLQGTAYLEKSEESHSDGTIRAMTRTCKSLAKVWKVNRCCVFIASSNLNDTEKLVHLLEGMGVAAAALVF